MSNSIKTNRRILLCFSSLVQDFSVICFESIIENFIKINDGLIDVIGHSPPSAHKKSIEILQPFCNELYWHFEPDPDISEIELGRTFKMERYYNSLRNNLLQWHSQAQLSLMKEELERKSGTYDVVVWSRPDLFWSLPMRLPDNLCNDSIYVSDHDHWSGVNDRFCFGESRAISIKLSIEKYFNDIWYDKLKKNPKLYLNGRYTWCPELVLADLIDSAGLNVGIDYSLPLRLKLVDGVIYVIAPGQYNSASKRWPFTHKVVETNGDKALFKNTLGLLKELELDPRALEDPRRRNSPIHRITKLAKVLLNRRGGLTPFLPLEVLQQKLIPPE